MTDSLTTTIIVSPIPASIEPPKRSRRWRWAAMSLADFAEGVPPRMVFLDDVADEEAMQDESPR